MYSNFWATPGDGWFTFQQMCWNGWENKKEIQKEEIQNIDDAIKYIRSKCPMWALKDEAYYKGKETEEYIKQKAEKILEELEIN